MMLSGKLVGDLAGPTGAFALCLNIVRAGGYNIGDPEPERGAKVGTGSRATGIPLRWSLVIGRVCSLCSPALEVQGSDPFDPNTDTTPFHICNLIVAFAQAVMSVVVIASCRQSYLSLLQS